MPSLFVCQCLYFYVLNILPYKLGLYTLDTTSFQLELELEVGEKLRWEEDFL